MNHQINTIDLFAGCGGLMEGFEKEGSYRTLACVEWEKAPVENIMHRLKTKWNHADAENEVIRFDIQRTDELLNGFSDEEYGQHAGLNTLVGKNKVNIIIGGPPCQAYSLAGRIRDVDGMKNDYRNYLFESYLKVVAQYQPNFFVFENVQGMLSAAPDGTPIVEKIKISFENAGYAVISNFKEAMFDLTTFGVPQNRKRLIILGVNKAIYKEQTQEVLNDFYNVLMPSYQTKKTTVDEAIGDLPKLLPAKEEYKVNGKKYSHHFDENSIIANHFPRFHSKRDIDIFGMLANDIADGTNDYADISKLKELYEEVTGKKSSVHKYYVLRRNSQSNTIPAHLYKDGLRHIHPDPEQMRSITVREAARLQTFDDDYEFIGGAMHQYKMIGNAVPPKFSLVLAKALKQIIDKYGLEG
ncbi:MAG: DNA cytosine methyltransferase [Faecalibacterium sp.]